jgi:hypothetical protein
MGGLYEKAILGSGDNIMALCLIRCGAKAVNENSTDDYKQSVLDFQERVKTLRLGYVPGVIRHYYHGSKKNRRYGERWQILMKYDYSPSLHTINNQYGVLEPTKDCPKELLHDIMDYFKQRNEDECYQNPSNITDQMQNIPSIPSGIDIFDNKNLSKEESSNNLLNNVFDAMEQVIGVNL